MEAEMVMVEGEEILLMRVDIKEEVEEAEETEEGGKMLEEEQQQLNDSLREWAIKIIRHDLM
jgi:hypothetical protein